MNDPVPFDPFDLMEGVLKSVFRPAMTSARQQGNGWAGTLPIDVAENDQSYLLWADLPGVRKEDVEVSINGRELTLSAQFKREAAVDQGQGGEQLLRRERPQGTVARTVTFPVELDQDKAKAEYRDGVLLLTLPKHASAQAKRIAVH